jgi:hypothetical protein
VNIGQDDVDHSDEGFDVEEPMHNVVIAKAKCFAY